MKRFNMSFQSFRMPSMGSLGLGLKAAIIAGAVLVLFLQDLTIVASDALQSDITSYVLTIPFLFAYLIYRKRKMLRAVMPLETLGRSRATRHFAALAGVLLSTTAVLLYWHGSYTFTPLEYHMLTLPIFVAGLTLILFNAQTLRQLAFPLAFLLFLMPPPSEILYALGSTLSIISSEASYTIVHSMGIPSTLTTEYGNPIIQITRPNGATMSFAVDIACSGIYSLIGFLVFAFFIAYIIRDKPWKRLTIFFIGIPMIYILNIIRITTILLIGFNYGEETALQLFHLLGGWTLIFLGTLLLLAFSEKIIRARIFAKPSQKCPGCNPNSKVGQTFCYTCGRILKPTSIRFYRINLVKIAAITVSIILLISIQAPVFALTEGPAQIIIQTPTGEEGNTQLLPQIQGYNLAFEYRDKEFEEVSRQDASLVYSYMPLDENKEPVWVTVEIGSSTAMLHRWEACLITAVINHQRPAVVTQLDLKDVQILENPPIIARYFAFRVIRTNQTQVVLYWYETSIFVANNSTQQKRVKISLITYPETPENMTKVEDLLPFATTIAQYWQPIKMWTQVALFLSQESIYLAAITSALLLALIVLCALQRMRQGEANARAYAKLSTRNKQIVDLINEIKKTTSPTLEALANAISNQTGETEEKQRLIQQLSQLEQTGMVSSEIANVQDEPTHVWSANMSRCKKARTQGT